MFANPTSMYAGWGAPYDGAFAAQIFASNSMPFARREGGVDVPTGFYSDAPTLPVDGAAQKFASLGAKRFAKASPLGGGGGGGGGGVPPESKPKILAMDILHVLYPLAERSRVWMHAYEFDYLVDKGLVERMEGDEYDKLSREILEIDLVEKDIEEAYTRHAELDQEFLKLRKKNCSRWHSFWSVIFNFGYRGLFVEEATLKAINAERKGLRKRAKGLQDSLKALIDKRRMVEGFVKTPYGCVRITQYGSRKLENLYELEDYLGDMPMGIFDARMGQLKAARDAAEGGGT